ncbi:SDR family NAD(P)-dependent oxidoreductase [Streptomyces sp. NPDC026206]|uniref:SDR family NAD(P)-dependent oxidoreductase n=1 Tax=Streptomyces sp. NPDC026206 TaxID=3157089 RepID=UPI0033CBFC41
MPTEEFTYTSAWRPAPVPAGPPTAPPGPVLIVHAPSGRPLADALARLHAARSPADEVVRLEASPHAPWPATVPAPRTVYFLGGLAEGAADGVAALERAEGSGVRALFRTARDLVIPAAATREADWRIVTNDAWAVAGGRVTNPHAASLAGLARVLESEHRRWKAPVVDLGLGGRLPGADSPHLEHLAALIAAEPAVRGGHAAHRDGARHVRALRPVTLPAPRPGHVRDGGTYVIVGGAGGIGLEVARFLARDHGARVALLGRSAPGEERLRTIREADPDGTRLLYVRADARDTASLRAGLRVVHERFGAVHGVIHSALAHAPGLVRGLGQEALCESLAAKSRISVALAEAFHDEPLDFLLFFSSVQSLLGDAGLAGYAAGSAFQDAYAHALDQRLPFPVRVVDWGWWGTVGAAAGAGVRERALRQGFRSISPREGFETVLRTLAGPLVQVLAVPAEDVLLRRLGLGGAGEGTGPRLTRLPV